MHPLCSDDFELKALIPDQDGGSWEREVYRALQRYTPPAWHVWWNKYQETGGFRHQYDFVVLVPRKGLVNLDAKGTGWTTDGQGQTICMFNGTISIRKDIFDQAEKAQITLQNVFKNKIGANWGACSHLLVFRDHFSYPGKEDRYLDNLGESLRMDNTCLQRKIEAVLSPFRNNFAYFSHEVQEFVLKHLNAEHESPTPDNTDDFRDWDQMAEEQLSLQQRTVLSRLKAKNNIHVVGAAGTGKTVIAMSLLRRYVQQGKRVLYVCFNRDLADELNYRNSDLADGGQGCIISYDKIPTCKVGAFKCAENVARRFPINGNNVKDHAMWEKRRKATADSLENATGVFDVLLVDEGQDLKNDLIFSLFYLLKPTRKIVVFSDSKQNLFNCSGWTLDERMFGEDKPDVIRLNQNWRNTDEIHNHFKVFEEQPEVESMIFENTRKVEIVRSCEQALARILEDHRRPCDIAVLYHADKQLAFVPNAVPDSTGHNVKLTDSIETWRKGKKILKESVESFKGLESPIVVFLEDGLGEMDELRYVGESRAKYELYIVSGKNTDKTTEPGTAAPVSGTDEPQRDKENDT